MRVKKIAILFSGNGSNLESIIQKVHNKTFNNTHLQVALTLTNNPNAYGIQRAQKYGLTSVIIPHKDFLTRQSFDEKIVEVIKAHDINLTVLAGFMRILSEVFTTNVKAINLHPSLLPLFKGANAIKQSYESDMKVAGVSVHEVSKELDGGAIIDQIAFRKENLSFEEFEEKIHQIEHEILPQAIIKILTK